MHAAYLWKDPTLSIDLIYLILGIALLLAAVLPGLLERYAVSAAMVLLVVGVAVGLLPLPEGLSLDPVEIRPQIDRITELAVLVALMGVGLAIDRPLRLRDRASWARWSPTWRLLAIGMPLTIAAVSLLGWGLGLAPAAALLLGAALAPTDPVLAGDVQVGGPHVGPAEPKAEGHGEGDVEGEARGDEAEAAGPAEAAATADGGHGVDGRAASAGAVDEEEAEEVDEEDDVRFALTSEAGLNDGLAFPFVAAALLIATGTATSSGRGWAGWRGTSSARSSSRSCSAPAWAGCSGGSPSDPASRPCASPSRGSRCSPSLRW